MNILVVTELFKTGGLETQTFGFCKYLQKMGHQVSFVVGLNNRTKPLTEIVGQDRVLEVDLGLSLSGVEVLKIVNKIVDFACSHKIDLIHCHPFMSLLIGGFVAGELDKPFVASLHGPSSLSSIFGPIYRLLLENIILPNAGTVFCVSEEVKDKASRIQKNAEYFVLKNGVNLKTFSPVKFTKGGPWALVARLDSDKTPGIKQFLNSWNQVRRRLDLGEIHIFGDGTCKEELNEWVQQRFEKDYAWVTFKGHTDSLAQFLGTGYFGVIGMGRVVIEGCAMNLPTFLLGYDGIKGIVDWSNVDSLSSRNFSGRGLPTLEDNEIERQIKDIYNNPDKFVLRKWVKENANEDKIWDTYLRKVSALNKETNGWWPVLKEFLVELGNDEFLNSKAVPNLIDNLRILKRKEALDFTVTTLVSENIRLQHEMISVRTTEAMLRQALFEQKNKYDEIVNRLEFNLSSLNNQLDLLKSKNAEIMGSLQKKETELTEKENEFISSREIYEEQILSYKNKINDCEAKISQYECEISQYKSEISQNRSKIEDMEVREFYDNSSVISEVLSELEKIRHALVVVRNTKAYRLAHLLKLIRSEITFGNWNQKKKFIKYLIKRFFKNCYGDYSSKNSLLQIENNIQSLSNRLIQKNPSGITIPKLDFKKTDSETDFIYGKRKRKGIRTVAYLTNQVVDWFDLRPRFGGGERYCLSLSSLLRDLGFDVTIYQAGVKEFEADYYGFKVIGIPIKEHYSEFHYGVCNAFYKISLDYDRVIYNLPEYSSGKMRNDAIMICHGIWFDHNNYSEPISFRNPRWFQHLFKSFSNPAAIISVDTNSINVIRSFWPELASKMHFIPNFVDSNMFNSRSRTINAEKLTVLFPRRSQINRGSRILEAILSNVPHDCEFIWVGEGDAEDTSLIKELAKRDQRLKYYSATFEEMPAFYRKADICVIPTIACEGTSFSCIESLSSGCATIATNVGGLPDIIQSSVNGILVDPTPTALSGAINFLIENRVERERLQKAAVESAQNFDIARWRERWTNILGHLGWIEIDSDLSDKGYMWF